MLKAGCALVRICSQRPKKQLPPPPVGFVCFYQLCFYISDNVKLLREATSCDNEK